MERTIEGRTSVQGRGENVSVNSVNKFFISPVLRTCQKLRQNQNTGEMGGGIKITVPAEEVTIQLVTAKEGRG